MLFELLNTSSGLGIGSKMIERTALELNVREKAIEELIAKSPEVLFQGEELLVIGQSVSGQRMADVLALDSSGALVIIEIKRNSSDRATVGQLLEYAGSLRGAGYERLNNEAQRYSHWLGGSLLDRFREFSDQPDFAEAEIGKNLRVVIVAPQSDESLRAIVAWLREYGVPIAFVPFSLYSDEGGTARLLEMESVSFPEIVLGSDAGWAGHWIFNTNETHAPGAWKAMFAKNVVAIYGYPSGPRNLESSSPGDKILAYVNQQGLRAVGTVLKGVVEAGAGIFEDPPGTQAPAEYHLAVKWECIVQPDDAISASQANALGYDLPVRNVFAKLHKGPIAIVLERQLRTRCSKVQIPTDAAASSHP
jgi:hypothetical protein